MDQSVKKKYNYWQWRTLIILMIGYALFYFVRKNFSITMPALEAELGISKVKLGLFLTLHGIIYGLSRFINGFIADRVSRKKMMATGLFLSALVNIFIGLSPEMNGLFNFMDGEGKATMGMVAFIGSLWLINGYTQGMGFPPCGSLMAHWIKPSELATKQAIWNSSHSIGASLVAFLCGTFILNHFSYSAWQWCFFVPALLAIAGAVLVLFGLKDTPASVGLPDPEEIDDNAPVKEVVTEPKEFTDFAYKRFVKEMVFKNPIVWILATSNFFIYIIRFTILDWGATFLTQDRGLSIQTASTVVGITEVLGIVGTLLAGWATDKFFGSKAHRTCLIGLASATACFILFWLTPKEMGGLSVALIIMASFFIYASGSYRNMPVQPGHEACRLLRQRHGRHPRLRQHSDLRSRLRSPCRQIRMELRLRGSHSPGHRRRDPLRHHLESPSRRLRQSRQASGTGQGRLRGAGQIANSFQ